MPTDQPSDRSQLDLEAHVRQLVDSIERGDEDDGAAAAGKPATGEPGGDPRGVERAVREILLEIGEDPDREGLLRTPERMHKMWLELTVGYHVDPDRLINGAVFDVG